MRNPVTSISTLIIAIMFSVGMIYIIDKTILDVDRDIDIELID